MEAKWSEIAKNLRNMLESGIFRVWVAPLRAEVGARSLRVFAPNTFMADWLKRHLPDELRKAASPVMGLAVEDIQLEILARPGEEKTARVATGAEVVASVLPQAPAQGVLPVKFATPAGAGPWRYRFDDFVTGPSNNIAVAAARDICQSGQVRTLFVTSAPGLGKTHLAQAAGQAIESCGLHVKVGYLTAEQFASRFVAAMRSRDLEEFKQYLCSLDVFLLEDVHFLQRKKAMQEMILGVIKNLQAKGSRVIFTSSFSPRQLQDMDGQLISHLCSGILTSMEKPGVEMRREILHRKASVWQVKLPDEICDVLSRNLSSDIRQLESCLKSMLFKARLMNTGLSIDLAMETLQQYAGAEHTLDLERIVRLVCENFGLTRMQLCSRSRKQEYVQGRNTVFYLARKHTEMSLEEIGCVFNRRHSTVLRSLTQVEREMARESTSGRQIARAVDLIERKCGIQGEAVC